MPLLLELLPSSGRSWTSLENPHDCVAACLRCAGGHWKLDEKLYFNQRGARVSAADYHAASGMLVAAFTNGIFDLYELPAFQNVHTLSVTRERISSATFNATGNWVGPLAQLQIGSVLTPHHHLCRCSVDGVPFSCVASSSVMLRGHPLVVNCSVTSYPTHWKCKALAASS